MERLIIETSLPQPTCDIASTLEHVCATGQLPPLDGVAPLAAAEVKMSHIVQLIEVDRHAEALKSINELISSHVMALRPTATAWLWLARMTVLIDQGRYGEALSAAENALIVLIDFSGKRNVDYTAIVASLLYNLAVIHYHTGDNSRAVKELTKSQAIFERLLKKDEVRYSAMLVRAVQASTDIYTSQDKLVKVFAHYKALGDTCADALTRETNRADRRATLASLVDCLANEGNIMLEMGNGRTAAKFFTKALRYQNKLNDDFGLKELQLSVGLARGLMKMTGKHDAAVNLLQAIRPAAIKLEAHNEIAQIDNLIYSKNKNTTIMNLLKSMFAVVAVVLSSIGVNAQLVVGHRGSVWGVENTEAAFVNGALAGAWGLECDIHVTADGAFVVCHDNTTKRIGGNDKPFGTINVAEAVAIPLHQTRRNTYYAGHLLTLGEYLDICNTHNVVPVIEIKYSDCATIHSEEKNPENNNFSGVSALLHLVKSKGLLEKVVFISFMPGVIEYIHTNYPDLQVQVLAGDGDINNWVKWCVERKIDLDVVWSMLTEQAVKDLHAAGLKMNVWTVDDPEVFARMSDWGVDFITTNAIFPNRK